MAYRLPLSVFAHYGNPDPKTAAAHWYRRWVLERRPKGVLEMAHATYQKMYIRQLEHAHLRVMRQMAANDATYYVEHGISDARCATFGVG